MSDIELFAVDCRGFRIPYAQRLAELAIASGNEVCSTQLKIRFLPVKGAGDYHLFPK